MEQALLNVMFVFATVIGPAMIGMACLFRLLDWMSHVSLSLQTIESLLAKGAAGPPTPPPNAP